MMPSDDDDDDDVHNPPRRGTRSWSTPDPVSRGRRYSYSRRKNEKGVFNKSQSFSPRKRDKRERERKERRIALRERESAPSNSQRIIRVCNRAIIKVSPRRIRSRGKKRKENLPKNSSSSSPGSGSSPLGRTTLRCFWAPSSSLLKSYNNVSWSK